MRVVAATNRDLEADIKAGRFRDDLYYRLGVVEVIIPALRERPEDLPPLIEHFVAFFARQANRPALKASPAACELLCRYAWPGNIRELRNAVERAIVLSRGDLLEPGHLPERLGHASSGGPQLGGDFRLDAIEDEHIRRVLARSATLQEAAAVLGMTPPPWRGAKKKES